MSKTMAIDWSKPAKERDCPLCSTETEVNEKKVRKHTSIKVRSCPGCGWEIMKGGRWSSPRRPEDYPVGSIGWVEGQNDA